MIKSEGIVLLFSLVVLTVSCKKDPLKGIDKNSLFAAPTTTELAAIQTDWQQRDLTPQDIIIEETHTINNKLDLS